MTDDNKIRLADLVVSFLTDKAADAKNEMPVMVGTLNKPQGIKLFKVAEVGHPVFEYKDRYILYLESENELTEKVYDHERQQFNTKVGYFTVAVPYYKETLKPRIDFTEKINMPKNLELSQT
jgi:hypothetical protein